MMKGLPAAFAAANKTRLQREWAAQTDMFEQQAAQAETNARIAEGNTQNIAAAAWHRIAKAIRNEAKDLKNLSIFKPLGSP